MVRKLEKKKKNKHKFHIKLKKNKIVTKQSLNNYIKDRLKKLIFKIGRKLKANDYKREVNRR